MQSSCLAPIKKTALQRNLIKPFYSKLNKDHNRHILNPYIWFKKKKKAFYLFKS